MAEGKTYAEFFALDSTLEKQFNKAANDKSKQEIIVVKANTELEEYEKNIKDEYKYESATDLAMDKWYGRLGEFGIHRGIKIGSDKQEFFKILDM